MGNGQPIGAVVTTAELLDEIGQHNMFFNTFTGSPVSSAAGLAVLRFTEQEDLMAEAGELSQHMGERLRTIAQDSANVGSIRGCGLLFGIDIIKGDGSRKPAPGLTKALIEDVRERGGLISRVRPHDNVLKMRPPLVFAPEHAGILLEQLELSLASLHEHTVVGAHRPRAEQNRVIYLDEVGVMIESNETQLTSITGGTGETRTILDPATRAVALSGPSIPLATSTAQSPLALIRACRAAARHECASFG